MKRALISDIHANYEALRVVLADIRDQGIREIYCLGDIVGYGPNPTECLDEVMSKCKVTILGNHDQAALFDPEGFNPVALKAIFWTRERLEGGPGTAAMINKRWDFLGELHKTHNEGDFLFVHGSSREPTNEYVFPEDVYNDRKMEALFGRVEKYCFQGHTHLPGIFRQQNQHEFVPPEECGYHFRLTDEKVMINVGSVGQPRDGDNRACYVVLHDDLVIFRRLAYPYEETVRKIYQIPDLDNQLGDRLRTGR